MLRFLSTTACVIFATAISAFSVDYTIPSFTSGGRSIPQQPDEIIAQSPDTADMLMEVPSLPSLAPGEVVMRRRFGSEEYRLYRGVFARDAFSKENNLFSFTLPAGMSVAEFAGLKFYIDRVTNPDNDIPTIYFDNTHAYVRIISRLYYNSGSWLEILASNVKVDTVTSFVTTPSRLTGALKIMPLPMDAEVFVNGESRGVGLKNIDDLPVGTYTVSAKKDGYQLTKVKVKVKSNETETVMLNLEKGKDSVSMVLTGGLKILLRPRDAEVFVNGESKGTGAKSINDLPIGAYTVSGKKDGYQLTKVEVNVKSNETDSVMLKLKKGKDKVQMVWIPGGTFMMGSKDGETPVHQVTVSGFYIGKYEVTQAEYKKVMGTNPSHFKGCPHCPVEQVSWNDAMEYCRKTGTRLPTEAEWEYACRVGMSTQWYWGDEMDGSYAWNSENSKSKTHSVGQKKPNAYGLYDVSGNVWEWCGDWYECYSSGSQRDPVGAEDGSDRVLRGGGWEGKTFYLRSTFRTHEEPDGRSNYIGFRVVRSTR